VASIRAVVDAGPPSDELYFVAAGQGRHLFAHTYERHLANIREAQKLRSVAAAAAGATPRADSLLADSLAGVAPRATRRP
jgi:hypothetical protein